MPISRTTSPLSRISVSPSTTELTMPLGPSRKPSPAGPPFMLLESLVYYRSYWRTPVAFRPHLVDAVGLWARGQRQFRAWTPHLNKTLAVLDTTIDDIASRRTVAVLGAGPLFDVPI